MEFNSSVIEGILRGARQQSESPNFEQYIDRLVMPGMILHVDKMASSSISWSFGRGLVVLPPPSKDITKRSVLISQFGILRHIPPTELDNSSKPANTTPGHLTEKKTSTHSLWLERPIRTGTPRSLAPLSRSIVRCTVDQFHVGDRVLGVVQRRAGDNYLMDIGCASPATLAYLAFEGASKKNRPDLSHGDVVYAMVTQADRDLEVELSCTDETGRAGGMGILGRHEPGTVGNAGGMQGGVMLHCSPDLVRRLADQDKFPLLSTLAKVFPFEVCLGTNGRIWLTARSPQETVLLANTIALADHIPPAECCKLAKTLH